MSPRVFADLQDANGVPYLHDLSNGHYYRLGRQGWERVTPDSNTILRRPPSAPQNSQPAPPSPAAYTPSQSDASSSSQVATGSGGSAPRGGPPSRFNVARNPAGHNVTIPPGASQPLSHHQNVQTTQAPRSGAWFPPPTMQDIARATIAMRHIRAADYLNRQQTDSNSSRSPNAQAARLAIYQQRRADFVARHMEEDGLSKEDAERLFDDYVASQMNRR